MSANSEKFTLRKQFFVQNTYKSWRKRCQNLYSNRNQLMGISNLGLQIWPKVVLWPFLRMRTKSGQNCLKRGQIAKKFRFYTKPRTKNLIFHSTFKAEVLWPFLCMRNSTLGKQPMRRRGPFTTTSRTTGNFLCSGWVTFKETVCRQQQPHEHG